MTASARSLLLNLCDTDTRLLLVQQRKNEIITRRETLSAELKAKRARQAEADTLAKKSRLQQAQEEEKLRNEQAHIVGRRKQLADLGAKAGKHLEREIEVAARSVESLENQLLTAMESVEQREKALAQLNAEVAELQERLDANAKTDEPLLAEFDNEILRWTSERDSLLPALDAKTRSQYQRIGTKYPGSAVAVATDGSCNACFRSLPAQLYNQLCEEAIIGQCPGCNRLLVAPAEPTP